ncbi:MAG: hypothetical protein RIT43_1051 [Bacteroidota bacterium]|jgi:hypothetical protein
MKRLLFFGVLMSVNLMCAQSRELYFGASLSDYHWTDQEKLNSINYSTGGHVGILKGRSDKIGCSRRLYRIFYPFFGAEYAYHKQETIDLQTSQFHILKAFGSFRYKLLGSNRTFSALFIQAEPGAAVVFQQTPFIVRGTGSFRAEPFELFLQAGFGGQIGFNRQAPVNSRYLCTGMTLSINKYFSVTPFSFQKEQKGKLDQIRLNLGFHFGYVKAKKSPLRFLR